MAAGAAVGHVECYRRTPPVELDSDVLDRWRKRQLDVITLTSITALKNLLGLLGEEDGLLLERTTIATVSERIKQHCRERGCRGTILVSDKPSDESLLEAIIGWDTRFRGLTSVPAEQKTSSCSAQGRR